MPRKLKLHSPTGFYHWISRGMNRQGIFHTRDDYHQFLSLVQEYGVAYDVKTYHYCLMTNHIHMIIASKDIQSVSQFTHFVKRRYAYYRSKVNKSFGATFHRAYANIPIDDERYLLECARYIDRNPLRANLVRSVEDYPYCSYHFYMSENANKTSSAISLTYSPAFLALSDTMTNRRALYKRYVTEIRPQEEYANTSRLGF